MIFGKIIGGLLGLWAGGIWLALLGLVVGHVFDTGYKQIQLHLRPSPEQLKKLQDCFFQTVFSLMGHIAKADGRISEAEISQTEDFMVHMGLTPEHRQEAIRLFKAGAQADFDVDACMTEFKQTCGLHPNLVQLLLVYLIHLALADGELHDVEEQILRQVAQRLGIPGAAFEHLVRMIRAQDSFSSRSYQHSSQYSGGASQPPPSQNQVELAYQALGVSPSASDAELKKAYRKLMSQYHPDKLTGQGVPEDMVQAATERSQEIQAAYELVKKSRGKK